MISIGIIGVGWVGSSVAISLLHKGVCQELLLCDSREGLAEGEAMDLNHGSSFYPGSKVSVATIPEMMECDAIVVTAGRGGKPDETRLDLLQENVKIAKNISEKLIGYKGILVVVSNPVDVLTYFYQKFSKIPANRVIGTGTMLDTARLREMIGRKLDLDPRSVHAQVVGEHGDSEVVLWSSAYIAGKPLRTWPIWSEDYEEEIAENVRKAAHEIIKRKGATNHAIGLVTATLLRWILRGERRVMTLSSVIDVEDINGVAISLPTIVGRNGIELVINTDLDANEKNKFQKSVEVLKKAIQEVDIS